MPYGGRHGCSAVPPGGPLVSPQALRGATAIAGVGCTEFALAGRSELQPARAISAAVTDAGLETADADRVVSYTVDLVEETELVRSVGFEEITWSSRAVRRRRFHGRAQHAASAVVSGIADVVGTAPSAPFRDTRFGGGGRRAHVGHAGTTATWAMPMGCLTPASWMALNATCATCTSTASRARTSAVPSATRAYARRTPPPGDTSGR